MTQVQARIAHQTFELTRGQVERAVRDVLPEPLDDHYAVVNGRRYPPKQVLALATGLDRADFNTHQARQVLRRLGFTAGRRLDATLDSSPARHRLAKDGTEAAALRPFVGQWVAQSGSEVLVAASTPQAVLAWLERHNQFADAMFRVPLDENDATGVAPA